MRIFRWLLLIANVILLMVSLWDMVVIMRTDAYLALIVGWVVPPMVGNIVFFLITWRWRPGGKAASRIAGAFD